MVVAGLGGLMEVRGQVALLEGDMGGPHLEDMARPVGEGGMVCQFHPLDKVE